MRNVSRLPVVRAHLARIVFVVLLVGCGSRGPSRSATELEQARGHLVTALDAWKKSGPTTKPVAETVTLNDDTRRSFTLVDYTVGTPTVPDARTISFPVTLSLKSKAGKEESRPVTYLVELGPPPKVTRDAYN